MVLTSYAAVCTVWDTAVQSNRHLLPRMTRQQVRKSVINRKSELLSPTGKKFGFLCFSGDKRREADEYNVLTAYQYSMA